MKTLRALLVGASLCVVAVQSLPAQENTLYPSIPPVLTYAAEFGLNHNSFSLDMDRTYDLQNSPFDAYREGTGISPYAYIAADYGLTNRFGVQLKLGFDQKKVGNTLEGVADCAVARPGGAVEYNQSRLRLDYEVTTTWFTIGAAARMNVLPNLLLTVGPTLHIRADSTTQLEIEDVPEGGPCVFEDGSTHRETVTRIQSKPDARFGLETSVGYRIEIAGGVYVVPTLRYQYMISDYIEDRESEDKFQRFSVGIDDVMLTNTRLHSVQLGVGVQFGL